LPISASAARSCGPQSHFRLPITSPVKQAECSRASTGFARSGRPISMA
jgi:hypothetical protein